MCAERRSSTPAFVVFGDDWGRHVSTMQHLFARIAPHTTVIWLNSIGHREPSLSDIGRGVQKLVAMVSRDRARPAPTAYPGTAAPQHVIAPRVLPWHSNRMVWR